MNGTIKAYADERARRSRRTESRPIIPAAVRARLPKLKNIRAVLWDVYGTLLRHSMGDMADQSVIEGNTLRAFRRTAREFGLAPFLDGGPAATLRRMYEREIEKTHRRKESYGVFSPEVRIERVWERILKSLQKRGYQPATGPVDLNLALRVAYFFEDVQEAKALYPGAKEILSAIRQKRLRQGIISNAQFYTPLTLDILLRDSATSQEEPLNELFDRRLIFFSYRLGVSKPNPLAFEKAGSCLLRMNIRPAQVVFVGNDVLNDMLLAHRAGFKSVLFAGDRNSITLRRGDRRVAGFEPDAIIKSLSELLNLFAGRNPWEVS